MGRDFLSLHFLYIFKHGAVEQLINVATPRNKDTERLAYLWYLLQISSLAG